MNKQMSILALAALLTLGAVGGQHANAIPELDNTLLTQIPKPLRAEAAAQSISGVPGVATQRAVVNFSDLALQEALVPGPKKTKAIHPPLPIPANLPVPSEVVPREKPDAAILETMPAPTAVSPAPGASFPALEDDDTRIPPDTMGAVGPNHLMVTLNSQVRIQDRQGRPISTVSLDAFWSSLRHPDTFDPKLLYDPFGNRWMFTAMANRRQRTSSVLIGVSETSDPTGKWFLFRIDADSANRVWADFPSIGFNRDWIVVQVNMFRISGDEGFDRSHIYVFDKADLYAGGQGRFTLISASDIGGTQVPAITYDNTISTLYMMQDWNGNVEGMGFLRLYTITGPVGSEVLTPVAFPSIANPWDFGPPNSTDFAPQLGSRRKIQVNDSRMHNVVFRNKTLWATQTVFLPAGGSATRSAVQWWQITIRGGVRQNGRIDDPTGKTFYAFPSIAVNQNNDVLIGYSRFSAAQFASANYSFRARMDPRNTLRADTVLKEGEAPYFKTLNEEQNRWGDYSNTVVDPVNDTDMWTIQEYAALRRGGSSRWGTWWAKIVPEGMAQRRPDGEKELAAADGTFGFGIGIYPMRAISTKALRP